MKRNSLHLIKFAILTVFTTFLTLVSFKLMRTYHPARELSYSQFQMFRRTFPNGESDRKMDWHDYEIIKKDTARKGFGEHGKSESLPPHLEEKEKELYAVNGFNGALSDLIALDRALPDIRHPECKTKLYSNELPYVSVVIPFYNEHWTTLLRTVHSVLNRSPGQLIWEIIMVNDFSSKEFLKDPLDEYVRNNLPRQVRVLHLPERMGLIRARVEGAKAATGQVLIFLDSHCEANVNWLPPLLEPIADDYKTCVCPFIDIIEWDTFGYKAQDEGARGAFNWDLLYKRLPLLPEDKPRPSEPFKSPVMAGGLFAISTRFFWELGGYDEGLDIWGGEQYELSFKIWQCGGQMVDAPCSRVGHIYRDFSPFPNPRNKSFLCENFKRVAEVWMDEYAKYYYERNPACRDVDPGDLTKQKQLRETLQCKPFQWFMEEIAFDLPMRYPLVVPGDVANGEIRSLANKNVCVSCNAHNNNEKLRVDTCYSDLPISDRRGNRQQNIKLSWMGEISPIGIKKCLDASVGDYKFQLGFYNCHEARGNQCWSYFPDQSWIYQSTSKKCLDYDAQTNEISLNRCDINSLTQKWQLQNLNYTLLHDLKDDIGIGAY